MTATGLGEDVRILLGREGAGEVLIRPEQLVVGAAGLPVDGGRGCVGREEQSVERGASEWGLERGRGEELAQGVGQP